MKNINPEDLRLTDAEKKACLEVGEKHGWSYWIIENALVRVKLGEKPPEHIMKLVKETQKIAKKLA
ncbi:hypothetical protein [Alicyclobacillus fastidiosus]|uniref:Uncharacterized protein n=1 Tax=Alicyclobacillus fastidiosus TaxID=392011 RepID=A0ABV5ALK8_9BACL|nr:hypothetical protein [Alicyclobacillus fastidiosus]WEH08504.1 hypothetical protein PYS47_17685 [Alicyclobacillus fastidiosus]